MRSLLLLPLLALVGSASAAAPGLAVSVDHAARLPVAGPVQNVIVGDAAVADVIVVNRATVMVQGKAPGRTEVIALGAGGREVWRGEVTVVSPAQGRTSLLTGARQQDYACAAGDDCAPVAARSGQSPPSAPPPSAVSGAAPVRPY